jgi:hypothetical protein
MSIPPAAQGIHAGVLGVKRAVDQIQQLQKAKERFRRERNCLAQLLKAFDVKQPLKVARSTAEDTLQLLEVF